MPLIDTSIVSAPGASLVPDTSGLAQQIGNALAQRKQQAREDERLRQVEQAKQVQQTAKTDQAQLFRVRNIKDYQTQRKEIATLALDKRKSGQDASVFVELLNETSPDGLNLAVTRAATAQGNTDKILDLFTKGQKGQAGLASAKTEILESGGTIQVIPSAKGQVGDVIVTNPAGKVVTGDERLAVLKESRQQSLRTLAEKEKVKTKAAGLTETQKLESQLKLKPQIESAVTEARSIATEKGEVFTDLSRMKAALPGLTETVQSLRELSLIATSTFGGRVFDTAVKESGFGSTKGATARAKFIAIVNNQVLPLLKPTFGAAFTVQEGESLRATLGDANASPAQKMATLDAFIAQKTRDIETKEAQLQPITQTEPIDQQRQQIDLSKFTTEQLMRMRQQAQ